MCTDIALPDKKAFPVMQLDMPAILPKGHQSAYLA